MSDTILSLVAFINLILCFYILVCSTNTNDSRLFSLLSFLASIWALTNYMTSVYSSSIWLESGYAFGVLVLLVGFIWTSKINERAVNWKLFFILAFISIIIFIGCYIPGFIAKSYTHIYTGGSFTGIPGYGLFFYTIFFVCVSFLIIRNILHVIKSSSSIETKKRYSWVLVGASVALISIALGSFILPSFSIFSFSGNDGIAFLIFLITIAFSITKHHLFGIRVVALELAVVGLWGVLFVRVLTAEGLSDLVIEAGILTASMIFGAMLIRSTLQEIRQRMVIEQLNSDINSKVQ